MAPNVVTGTFGALAPGASATFSIGVHINPVTQGTITYAVVLSPAFTLEFIRSNIAATATTTVNRVADLSISKTGPATATAGTDITYTEIGRATCRERVNSGAVADTLTAATTYAGAS